MELQGVVTTGIYCRASCSARPRREHVRPVRSGVEALRRGFRPCLLCRPDELPLLGDHVPVREIALAVRLIADGHLDDGSTADLARRTGYSERQLTRLFEEHIGASPAFVAKARRSHFARRLIDETDLPLVDIAVASGFSSTRTLRRSIRELFGFSPSELRRKRRANRKLDPLDGGLRLRVPVSGEFDASASQAFLRSHLCPSVDTMRGSDYRRTIRSCDAPGVLELAFDAEAAPVATLHLASFGSLLDVITGLRRQLGVLEPSSRAEEHLAGDPHLGKFVRSRPGVRLPGAFDRFETAVRILVGQQVSVKGAMTILGRIADRAGEPVPRLPDSALTRLFPSAERLARADLRGLGMPNSRATTISRFAEEVTEGRIDLRGRGSLEETTRELAAIAGIGPWSASLIAARVCGEADAFPSSDLALRREAAWLIGRADPLTPRELEELAESWRPYRATAVAYLWQVVLPARIAATPLGEAG